MSIFYISVYAIKILLVIISILSIVLFRRGDRVQKLISLYIIGALIIEVTSRILINNGKENLFLLNLLTVFQFVIFSHFFQEIFKNKNLKKMVKNIIYIVLVFLIIQYTLDYSLFFSYNPVGCLFTMTPIIIYSLLTIFKTILVKRLSKYSLFVFGLLMYMSSSLIVFLSSNLLVGLKFNQFTFIYTLNNIAYIIFLILIIINIWKLFNLKPTKF